MYSTKTDSYALGIILYYLITKEYPVEGSSLKKLIQNHKTNKVNWGRLDYLPVGIIKMLRGLCQPNLKERLLVLECNFEQFLSEKSITQIESCLQAVRCKVSLQVTLCQFINYLMRNSMEFLSDDHMLYSMISNHLQHLTTFFKWEESNSLREMKAQYILPDTNHIKFTEKSYRRLIKAVEATIFDL